MLFLGTAKYPLENEFDKFLSEGGGMSNAFITCSSVIILQVIVFRWILFPYGMDISDCKLYSIVLNTIGFSTSGSVPVIPGRNYSYCLRDTKLQIKWSFPLPTITQIYPLTNPRYA
jgi:hypothetical protein